MLHEDRFQWEQHLTSVYIYIVQAKWGHETRDLSKQQVMLLHIITKYRLD
jgi:hypothetical protein